MLEIEQSVLRLAAARIICAPRKAHLQARRERVTTDPGAVGCSAPIPAEYVRCRDTPNSRRAHDSGAPSDRQVMSDG